MRAKHASASVIFTYLGLNMIPSFFDLMPIGLWLATCFLLKELEQRHEWEPLQLLTFIPKKFFVTLLVLGVSLGLCSLVLREQIVIPLAFKSERFKQDKFKQRTGEKIVSKWLELDPNQFCYVDYLDLQKQEGEGLLVLWLSPEFVVEKLLSAPQFYTNQESKKIIIPQGQLATGTQSDVVVGDHQLYFPSFFSQIRISLEVPRLYTMAKKAILYKDYLPQASYNELLYAIFMRTAYYFQIVLYPIMTLILFMLSRHSYMRWLLALIPYPFFTLLAVVTDNLYRHGMHPILLLLPYAILIMGIFGYWAKLARR